MTDPEADERYDHLRGILADLERARERVTDLEHERDEEVVRVVGPRPESGRRRGEITDVARAARLSRQHVHRVVKAHEEGAGLPRRSKHNY